MRLLRDGYSSYFSVILYNCANNILELMLLPCLKQAPSRSSPYFILPIKKRALCLGEKTSESNFSNQSTGMCGRQPLESIHRDLAKASKRVAKNPFFGKFYLMWSKECVKTTTML